MAGSDSKPLVLSSLAQNIDILVAGAVISILLVMIIPLPPPLLDMLLALNITMSLVTLLVALYTSQPLEFSVFPSLLLMLTLFRLSECLLNPLDPALWQRRDGRCWRRDSRLR